MEGSGIRYKVETLPFDSVRFKMISLATLSALFGLILCASAETGERIAVGNGNSADLGEFSFQALLYRQVESKRIPFCGGVIVSERHILTSATCAEAVLASKADVSVGNLTTRQLIKRIKVHENFVNGENNVAVLEVTTKFDFTQNISIIQLDNKFYDAELNVTALGVTVRPTVRKSNFRIILCANNRSFYSTFTSRFSANMSKCSRCPTKSADMCTS